MAHGDKMNIWQKTLILALALLFSGCSVHQWELPLVPPNTKVERGHPLIQHDLSAAYAQVYFIRPHPEHAMGFSDNDLRIDADGKRLLKLGKGEYTMINLKPRSIKVTMTTTTQLRGRWELTDFSQTREIDLKAGGTYFVLAKMVDGEFRGVRFVPTNISLHDAKVASKGLRAMGQAKQAVIENL